MVHTSNFPPCRIYQNFRSLKSKPDFWFQTRNTVKVKKLSLPDFSPSVLVRVRLGIWNDNVLLTQTLPVGSCRCTTLNWCCSHFHAWDMRHSSQSWWHDHTIQVPSRSFDMCFFSALLVFDSAIFSFGQKRFGVTQCHLAIRVRNRWTASA